MKILAVTFPLLIFIVYVAWCFATKRPLSRHSVNSISSVLLLYYLTVTAGLGIFWVARMELPVFDLHYLFGYCVLILLVLHLYFQMPKIFAFLGLRNKNQRPVFLLVGLALLAATGAFAVSQIQPFVEPVVISPDELPSPNEPRPAQEPPPSEEPILEETTPSFLPPASEEANSPSVINLRVGGRVMTAAEYILHSTELSRRWAPRLALVSPGEFRTYPEDAYVALPPARLQAGRSFDEALRMQGNPSAWPSSPKALTLSCLSDILFHASGVTEQRTWPGGSINLRAAPSAGALYPVDLFVFARSVEGLAPGLYYYHPLRHALARVGGAERIEAAERASAYDTEVRQAPAFIVAGGVWDRTEWKYGHRSYRYVLLDLGHVIGNLTLALANAEQPFRLIGRFDDEKLTEVLGMNRQDEAALLMVTVGVRPETHQTISHFAEVRPADGLKERSPTRHANLLTSWKMLPGSMPRPAPVFAFQDATREVVSLPDGVRTNRDLFETIRARRSARNYARVPLPLDEATGFLRDTWGGSAPSRGFPTVEGGLFMQLYLVVERVEGLAPGIYRYESRRNELERIADGRFGQKVYRAGLSQELLERAAMTLIWMVDMETVGKMDKDRDLRYALIDAGIAGTNAYLSAVARGWGICGVGAFFDGDVSALAPELAEKEALRPVYLLGVGPL